MVKGIDPNELRKKFNTKAGLDAFERLNALGAPRWAYDQDEGAVYLSPSIEIAKKSTLTSIGASWGANLDDVVVAQEAELKKLASEPGTRIVTNAFRDNRTEFSYRDNAFRQLKP